MDPRGRPPYKTDGLLLVLLCAAVLTLVSFQFRGAFVPAAQLTLLADRAGLVMDTGASIAGRQGIIAPTTAS